MEAELKLELTEQIYRGILEEARETGRVRRQTNIVFDSKERRLAAERWALRLRLEENEAFLTVKGKRQEGFSGAVFVREENEVELDLTQARSLETGFRLGDCELAPARRLLEVVGDLDVVPRLRYYNERRELRLAGWEVELDKTFDNDHVSYELELETEAALLGEAEAALRSLFSSRGWTFRPSSVSKLARAEQWQEGPQRQQAKRE